MPLFKSRISSKQAGDAMRRFLVNKYRGVDYMIADKIICLVGPSGSGKTTIAKELEKEGYNIIHSHTTRHPREKNEWGHTFINYWDPVRVDGKVVGFENPEHPESRNYRNIDIDDMIAYKEVYEGLHYFATKEQYQGKGTSIYIVDPNGSKQVHENVKDAEVITIFLGADEETRFNRMLEQNRTFKESIDRVNKDREIFKVCKCNYTVDADRELKEVLNNIENIIENQEE